MKIENDKAVTINYKLTDNDGYVIDETNDGSFTFLCGANNIITGLEQALLGKIKGDELTVNVKHEDGYGKRHENRIQTVPRDMFPEDAQIEPGVEFHAEGSEGEKITFMVTSIEGETVHIDGNHPLADVDLNFDVSIVDVRDALAVEIEHGHAHGPDGQHHH